VRTPLHGPRIRGRSVAAATLGVLTLIGSFLVAAPAQALSDTGTGGVYVPAAGRVLDTGEGIGGYNTPMPAKGWRTINVAGQYGIPDDGTVGAISVVATESSITAQGQLFGRPNDSKPATMMGIYGGENKQITSFSSVLAVSPDGTIQIQAETQIRLFLDVQGYYTANTDGTAAGGFVPMNGTRIVDTREGRGAPQATVASGKSIDVQVAGTTGVPSDASGAIINMIAVNRANSTGYLTPYPTGSARPANSFNYAAAVPTSMQAQVQLSASGQITIFNANSTTDIVVEVQGYFTAKGKGGAMFTPAAGRVYDTRVSPAAVMGPNETRSIQVSGVSGIPVMGSGINAVVLTLTSLKSTAGQGNATVWADGTTRPGTTAINFDPTTIRTNTITVPLGENGKILLNSVGDSTNYVIDLQGWYSDPAAPRISCPSPFVSDAWIQPAPSAPVNCTVTAPPATSSSAQITVSVDAADAVTRTVPESVAFSQSVQVAATRGAHLITATRIIDGTATSTTVYPLTFGTWTESALVGAPTEGEVTHLNPYLSVTLAGADQFPRDSTYRYYLSDSASTQVLWDSGQITKPFAQVSMPLTNGVTYSWHAEITGSVDPSGTQSTVVTPVFSFTASDHAAGAEQAATTSSDGTWTASDANQAGAFAQDPSQSSFGVSRRYADVPYCSSRDNTSKTVRIYERKAFPGVVGRGGVGTLICGTPGGMGMRHIWAGHGNDWIGIVNKYPMGISAESFMDQSINTTLRAPSSVVYNRANDTYTYYGLVQIKQKGKVVRTYTVKVGHSAGSWRIITAFPT